MRQVARTRVTYAAYEARGWGVGEVWLDGDRVVQSEHPRPGQVAQSHKVHPLAERVRDWFAGAEDDFLDVELELDGCTPFQLAAVDALRHVPRGEVVTYGELAALAGSPGASRAIGTLCATNRFAVIVPCHRVVAASGIGGYGSLGEDYKRRLLELDGVPL
jgi:methylated-DNA-[protein]-cysteine S-methyltransferase